MATHNNLVTQLQATAQMSLHLLSRLTVNDVRSRLLVHAPARPGVGICVAALVVTALIIFLLQNTQPVLVTFLSLQGTVPLAIALLIAGIGVGVCRARLWNDPHQPATTTTVLGAEGLTAKVVGAKAGPAVVGGMVVQGVASSVAWTGSRGR